MINQEFYLRRPKGLVGIEVGVGLGTTLAPAYPRHIFPYLAVLGGGNARREDRKFTREISAMKSLCYSRYCTLKRFSME